MTSYLLTNSPQHALDLVKHLGFKQALLVGGATLNSAFLKEKLIDEIVLNIEPYLLGKGIKTFEGNFESELKLLDLKKLKSGIVQLEYQVKK